MPEDVAIEINGCDRSGRIRFNVVFAGEVWSKRAIIPGYTAIELADDRVLYDSFMDSVLPSMREELWEDLQKKYRGAK